MKLSDAIDRYVSEILIDKSKNHQYQTQQELRYWSSKVGHIRLDRVTPAMIREHIPEGKPSTIARYLSVLSTFYNTMIIDYELARENPVSKVRKPKLGPGRTRYLSDNERSRLLEACRNSPHPYLYTIVVICLSTGARRSEITTLKWDRVDLQRQIITISQTKNPDPKVLPLVGLAHQLVMELPRSSEKVFPGKSIKYAWLKALDESGIKDFTFHSLRHTAASYLAMQDVPLLTIATILGHKSVRSTQRYSHLSTNHLRGVLGNLNDMMFPDSP